MSAENNSQNHQLTQIEKPSGGHTTIGTDPASGRDWTPTKLIEAVEKMKAQFPKTSQPNLGKIFVDKQLCIRVCIGYKRNHQKKRINKKWHKKYGPITKCYTPAFQNPDGSLIMCPCRKAELVKLRHFLETGVKA